MIPKTLSVILPNYNHSKYLPQSIEAIMKQSYLPTEVILVDDASTDDSVEILQSYAEKYPSIRLICNKKNEGAISVFQNCWAQVTGEYLYAASADDYVLPGFFEKTMKLMGQYPEAGFCSGLTVREDGDKKYLFPQAPHYVIAKTPIYLNRKQVLNAFIKKDWPIAGNTVIWRTKAARDLNGFPKELLNLQDEFTTQMLGLNYGACFIPEPLCHYRIVSGSFSSKFRDDITKMQGFAEAFVRAMETTHSDKFPDSFVKYFKKRTCYTHTLGKLINQERSEKNKIEKIEKDKNLGHFTRIFCYSLIMVSRLKKLALSLYLFLRFGSPSWFRTVRYFYQYKNRRL